MFRIRVLTSCLLAGGFLCVGGTSARAQTLENEGIIRISDSPASSLTPIPAGTSVPGDPNCPPAGISGNCGYGRHAGRGGYRFTPPVKRPIFRSPVSYTKGFPDAWTGATNPAQQPAYRAPTVYMPTDTTQLGYYYQVVPYWQPKPGAVPPPPIPSQWHTTVDQLVALRPHPAGLIYGTAPTAVPNTPTPPPWGPQGVPPEPTPASTPTSTPSAAPDITVPPQPGSLERSTDKPSLLPIQ